MMDRLRMVLLANIERKTGVPNDTLKRWLDDPPDGRTLSGTTTSEQREKEQYTPLWGSSVRMGGYRDIANPPPMLLHYSTVEWPVPFGARAAGIVRYDPYTGWSKTSLGALAGVPSIQVPILGNKWEGTLLMVYE